jgi:ADP-ribosyl-[dinitrogen reductase] hydrolase
MSQGRVRGSFLGLAIGDAVGTTNEFSIDPPPIRGMVGGGPFALRPGEWTDDTSMALCLADSLIHCGGFDANDQMERYLRWADHGYNSVTGVCFDIGLTINQALQRFRRTRDPFAGDPSPEKAGNGSLMRLAPVVLYYWPDSPKAVHYARESSRTTHAAPQCIEACEYFARLICRALDGAPKAEILAPISISAGAEIRSVADGSFARLRRNQLRPSGYVVESMQAALWCFANTDNFRSGCLRAANLGGDSDTIAAIYGQLAGAHYGEEGLPKAWIRKLAWAERITELADILYSKG